MIWMFLMKESKIFYVVFNYCLIKFVLVVYNICIIEIKIFFKYFVICYVFIYCLNIYWVFIVLIFGERIDFKRRRKFFYKVYSLMVKVNNYGSKEVLKEKSINCLRSL